MQTDKHTVVLILRTGGDFHFSDVSLLASSLQNSWGGSVPLEIVCFTNLVETEPLSLRGFTAVHLPNNWPGWWSKMNLFSPALKKYRPFLYMDLDTLLIDGLDGIIPEKDEKRFITLEDFYKPGRLASGIMWIPDTEKVDLIWKKWIRNPSLHMRKLRGDQDFIGRCTTADQFWQKRTSLIGTFKPKGQWRITKPNNLSIVCFHGNPRIPKAAKTIPWVREYVTRNTK